MRDNHDVYLLARSGGGGCWADKIEQVDGATQDYLEKANDLYPCLIWTLYTSSARGHAYGDPNHKSPFSFLPPLYFIA